MLNQLCARKKARLRKIVLVTLLPSLVQARAHEHIEHSALFGKLARRAVDPSHWTPLDDTTLWKPAGHLAIHPRVPQSRNHPVVPSGSVQLRKPRPHRCVASCTARMGDATAAQQRLDRRSAALVVGGIALASAQPALPAAEDRFIAVGQGLKYYDFIVGTGAAPSNGDVIQVLYSLRVPSTGTKAVEDKPLAFGLGTDEVKRGWELAVLGTEQMASMKIGGIRNVLIPAELAYAGEGSYCSNGRCLVPPDSTIQLTIELVDIQNGFVTLLERNGIIPKKRTRFKPAYCASRYYATVAGGNKGTICNSDEDAAQYGVAIAATTAVAASGIWSSQFKKVQKSIVSAVEQQLGPLEEEQAIDGEERARMMRKAEAAMQVAEQEERARMIAKAQAMMPDLEEDSEGETDRTAANSTDDRMKGDG
eukprot:gnl/TRDRNA2_/TRDRNA2_81191_c0_seq1.p1 gnl/TRDRNA2_/TRDRNA2_81191_c0~~gnl/TRDRNA2_/TRDRNA2_81191_c0_seq1.p1  ORF type:complete len:421 (-),score=77.09 gnl/TRDRNA2_/TRDRNA2_81191_c0_seq1:18-1280(-)